MKEFFSKISIRKFGIEGAVFLCAIFLIGPLNLSAQAGETAFTRDSLTGEERAWLASHPVIRIGIDNAWPPLEFVDGAGDYSGMAADYLALVEQRLGIELRIETGKSWNEVVQAVKAGELDAFSLVVETPQRKEYLEFTDPYLSFPYVIITLDDKPFVDGIEGLRGETVAVVKNYAIHDLLKRNHPDLDLYNSATVKEGLEAVLVGKVFAFVGNLAVVTQVLRDVGITNLKVSGQTQYRSSLGMAVRKDFAQAVPIFNSALASISNAERDAIHARWLRVQFDKKVDLSSILAVLLISFMVFAAFFLWCRRLSREISKRVVAEVGLTAAKREADRSNEAKSAFLANISHELRTPMNGVLGMAGLLLKTDLSDKQRHFVSRVQQSGDALLHLLDDILDLSKIESGQLELEVVDFDLQDLVDGVTTIMGSRAQEKAISLDVAISAEVPSKLLGDPGRIRQVLYNLVGNAIKFTEQGHVTLRITKRATREGSFVLRFAVTDTGIGIAEDARDKIFDKFTQADASTTRLYGGSGLGLSICRELASSMGGDVGVNSTVGVGSTFWFTVACEPGTASDQTAPAHPGSRVSEGEGSGAPLRVLVAEDNEVNQEVMS